jgi:hypothetical protein
VNGLVKSPSFIDVSHSTKYILFHGTFFIPPSTLTANFWYLFTKLFIALLTASFGTYSDVAIVALNKSDAFNAVFQFIYKYLSNSVVEASMFPDGVFCTVYEFVSAKSFSHVVISGAQNVHFSSLHCRYSILVNDNLYSQNVFIVFQFLSFNPNSDI